MTTKAKNNKTPATRTVKKESLTGDHYTLNQIADMCGDFQTEYEMVNAKKNSISDYFMDAAKMYIEKGKPTQQMEKDHPFLEACKAQEDLSKSTAAGVKQWDKIPANWSQMKSNVKAAYNKGIDIHTYDHESKMREDLNDIRKAEKGEKVDQVEDSLTDATEGASPELTQRLFAINNLCKGLTEAQTDDAIRSLDEAIQAIAIMKELVKESTAAAA